MNSNNNDMRMEILSHETARSEKIKFRSREAREAYIKSLPNKKNIRIRRSWEWRITIVDEGFVNEKVFFTVHGPAIYEKTFIVFIGHKFTHNS